MARMRVVKPTDFVSAMARGMGGHRCTRHQGQPGGPDFETVVYRFYNADGDLLYVGIARSPAYRWQSHRSRAPWWKSIATLICQSYEGEAEARAAEALAISEESPMFNIARPRVR